MHAVLVVAAARTLVGRCALKGAGLCLCVFGELAGLDETALMCPVAARNALLERAGVRVSVVVDACAQGTILTLLKAESARVAQIVVSTQESTGAPQCARGGVAVGARLP